MADPDLSIFNLFPRLPPELRLKVWKEAVAAYIQDATEKLWDGNSRNLELDDERKVWDSLGFTILIEPLPIMATCSEAREAAIRFNLRPQPVRFLYVPPRVRSLKAERTVEQPIFLDAYYGGVTGSLGIDGGVFDSPQHLVDVVHRYVGSDFFDIGFECFADDGSSHSNPWVYWPEIPFSSDILTDLDGAESNVSHDDPTEIPRVVDPQLLAHGPKGVDMVVSVTKGSRRDIRVSRMPSSVDPSDKILVDGLTEYLLQVTELLETSQNELAHVRSVTTRIYWGTMFQANLRGDKLVGWASELE